MRKPKQVSRRWLWYWKCHWTNGYGCYDADYGECRAESRRGWSKREQASRAANRHNNTHPHGLHTSVYRQCESQHVRERRS